MKKLIYLGAGIAYAISLPAQQTIRYSDGSYYKQCIYVKETKPLKELIAERDAKRKNMPAGKIVPHVAADAKAHEPRSKGRVKNNPDITTPDGARQSADGTQKVSSTIVNIDGQQSLQGEYPLDPNGMIGSNYYVQTVNSNFAAYYKTGASYIPSTDLYNLFGSIGQCDGGDPVTLYDKIADRWIITEFEGTNTLDTLLFAISQTNDPAGKYWLYAFDPDDNNTDDYPKYNVWADGYYMTCNCGNNDYVIVYDRTKMLTGNPSAGLIAMPWNASPRNYVCQTCAGPGFFCPMMLDCDGTLPPYGSPEYLFYYWDINWLSGGNNEIIINKISVNWNTKSGTITVDDTLPTASFNSVFTGGTRADIAQPGSNSSSYLDALDGFFSYRIPYLRWSSYNTALMSNVVNVGTSSNRIGGIRWYELHQDTTTKVWSIYQQSTYAPNDGVSRWNPSIAMDQNGNIGLAYSVSDPVSVYPGCRYTGRMACDALNTMTVSEVNAYSGNALANTPEGWGNRWGDYSHLSIDPVDGITFWHTNMYTNTGYGGAANIGTRIYTFQIPKCTSTGIANTTEPQTALTAYQNGGTLNIKAVNLPEGQRVVIELFDINGKKLMEKAISSSYSTLETSFNVSALSKAIYIVRMGNDSFQRVIKTDIH